MAGSSKKTIVRLTDGTTIAGYAPLSGFTAAGQAQWLGLSGKVESAPLLKLLWIAYVRDWNLDDPDDPERLNRRTFLARPRVEGLWLRLTLSNGEMLEGLGPLDRSLLDQVALDDGLALLPPDARGNTQRLFVPRAAISALTVLGVITTPSKSIAPKATPAARSGDLFPPDPA